MARESFPGMADESYDALLTSWSGFPGFDRSIMQPAEFIICVYLRFGLGFLRGPVVSKQPGGRHQEI